MANQVTNYKCPACTGPLRFDSATGKLQCDFCGSSYEVAEIEKLYAEKDAQAAGAFRQAEEQAAADGEWTSASGSDWGADAEKLRVYSCPSCGAELICDETTSATSCPYCGNNTIVPGQFSGALKPDYVLPFKLDKAAAVAALKKHYGGKKLLPKAFSNENHIEEVKGVYVPFWLYDGSAEVDVRCHGTKVSGYSTARENVTVTNHYDVRRAGTVRFERVPVDASSKMPDDHMDAIEPFDYKELKPFSTAYLPGFLADKYDVSVQDCAERADSRCETSAVELMEQDARGDYTSCTVRFERVPVDASSKMPDDHMDALSMAERDFQMLAHGDTANAAFTDYGKYIMQDEFLDNFREDDWYGGFADYIAACGRYLEANANGAPIDVEPSDETEEEYEPLSFGDKLFFAALMAFRFGLPLGLIVAFIVCAVYKRQLKSVRRATEAARYTVSGGAEITAREDRFTHTTEVRTPIKTESDDHDSGPSFSGGTTVNSGGFSHSGGKF